MSHSKLITLTIRTPEQECFSGQVRWLKFRTEMGQMQILPHHASVTGTIDYTHLSFLTKDGTEDDLLLRRGVFFLYNQNNHIDIFVLYCLKLSEFIPATAEEYLRYIESQFDNRKDMKFFQLKFYKEEKFVIEKQLRHLAKFKKNK